MYDPSIAFHDPAAIRQLQETKLQALIPYLAARSPFYRRLFEQHGIDPAGICKLEDLRHLPVTEKEDIQLHNWDFLTVPRENIAEYMASSGTLGSPVTIALTAADLDRLAYNEYCSFVTSGGTAADRYQLMLTLDRQFMAGIAYYLGIRKLGAGLVRVGPGAPFLHWDTIRRIQPTVLVGVPSFLIKLQEFAMHNGIDLQNTPVKTVICIGESIRDELGNLNRLGQKISEGWPVQLISTYASTEMQTAFTECVHGTGGHMNPELIILEILDEHNQPVADGMPGEVTITTLGVEGMPLLRYKTGDICIRQRGTCACGRQTDRLSAVLGRKKQMIKLKGTSFYPPALYDLLHGIPEVVDYVVELQSNEWGTDEVLLHLQVQEPSEATEARIRELLRSRLRVIPGIRFLSGQELHRIQFPEGGRKAQKLLDNR
ncbi:phenylacetate--CoA ligase family protein [Flavihumibacter petaseus]|uniref:Putative acyl-CoA synthetase n=1 Tax=Flavihumibacter petaseus NBRC 106054 TaxID=1220578 RepID=A0A0E9MX69_9BACT|nr:AMP-binding protein [Flavihumibacter petaseus]GAO42098.1 putative acyl-CoA synthetase [Flavihumibacter petaseus NBRC 106054]